MQVVALVNKAAGLVKTEGRASFNEFRKPGSEWFNGNTYLFVYDMKGNVLFNAAFPKREGMNIAGDKDANGKLFQDEILKTAETKGSGWISYVFPKPGQTQPSQKWTYVRRITVDGVPGLIGAGFYLE